MIKTIHSVVIHSDVLSGSKLRTCLVAVGCAFAAIFLLHIQVAEGQAIPAAEAAPISTGFQLPVTAGSFSYGVSLSEDLAWGSYGQTSSSAGTIISGDVAYISTSKRDPFSLIFSGGHSWGTGSSQPSYSFLNLAASQVFTTGRWSGLVSDSVNYLPGTPTTGLSGVAGVGDLGINPVNVGVDTGQGVLTDYSDRIGNTAAASLQRQLTGKTSINFSGSDMLMHFLKNSNSIDEGLDSNAITGQAGLNYRLDGRNTVGGSYAYSSYQYSGNALGLVEPGFHSQTVSAVYSRLVNRKISFSASAGPQWITTDAVTNGNITTPSQTTLSSSVSLSGTYSGKSTRGSLSFVRGSNSGSGVLGGALSDSLNGIVTRTLARVWGVSGTASYTRTSSLPGQGITAYSFNTTVFGAQVSRAIGRSLSAYGSFTLENQSDQGTGTTTDLFSGRTEVLGFGLTYSPRSIHMGRQ